MKSDTASQPTPFELRKEVRQLCADWQQAGRYTPRSDSWLRSPDPEFSKELAARGLIGLTWPAPYGKGLSNVHRLAVTEELLRAGAPVASHWIADRQIGPTVLRHGNPRLQAEILPGIASADLAFCLGLSEPEAGSDLASARTRALPDGDGFRISGRKIWTSGAHHATHAYVLARTTPRTERDRPHRGLSEFVVDMTADGVGVSPIVDMTGEHHFNEVTFDDVRVSAHRLIGTEGEGWRQVTEQLAFERGGPERVLTTYPLLLAILRDASPLSSTLAPELGRFAAQLGVLRRLCHMIAEMLDAGAAPVQEAATCKLLGNAFERDVLELARRVVPHGPPSLRQSLDQALLASPGFSLRGGASEVLLSIVTKNEVAS
ncbi:acyl-CoA dehydrogenase family protein [Pseudonocardia sp. KRD291]|uniref:acyl-CoA dehydrogenase family protein n=1 Tax=Pseudonocardia sp. KRD291 TaxID=2792007 RepID=UPI001C4A069E|nr:acyl-CoA dehydrogenase family protein [Pseudonocardia sp. KRD291]